MDELIKQIAKKFNLPEETAKGIVQLIADFLKQKMPEPIGSQVSAFLVQGKLPQDAQGLLGGLLGQK